MSKFSFVCLIGLLVPLSLIAQGCSVIKTYAFVRPFIPGNIIAENEPGGRPEDRIFIYEVYLETNCNHQPVIQEVWINNNSYTATITLVSQKKVAAGILQNSDDTAFVVKTADRNALYKVEFQQATGTHTLPAAYRKTPAGKILLQTKVDGKIKMILTPSAQMLQPEVVY